MLVNNTFAEFAHNHFATLGWLEKSGAFIYTSPDSLRPGRTLILGTNPGGSVETHLDQTVRKALVDFADRPSGWSAWFNEGNWGSKRKFPACGSAPLQKHVAKVLAVLGHPAELGAQVCSTQLIFLRSSNVEKLDGHFSELAEHCWPINERVLREVQPHRLMIIGNSESKSPWSFLRDKFSAVWSPRPSVGYGHCTAKLKAAEFTFEGRPIVAIGFPHFSGSGSPTILARDWRN